MGGIRRLSETFASRARDLTDRQAKSASAVGELTATTSKASGVLEAQSTLLQQRFGEAAEGSAAAQRVLDGYASELEQLQDLARRRLHAAATAYDEIWSRRSEALYAASEFVTGWALGWDAVLPSWMYLDDQSYLRRWQGAIDAYRGAAAAYNALQGDRTDIDQRAVAGLSSIALVAAVRRGGKIGSGGLVAGASVWVGALTGLSAASLASLRDPGVVRDVWNKLTPEGRQELIKKDLLIIGNLNGIPIGDRVAANRINIRNEIARREREMDALKKQRDHVLANLTDESDATELSTLTDQINDHKEHIDSYNKLLTEKWQGFDGQRKQVTQTGLNVVVFDPATDAIATYYGAIDPTTRDIPVWVQHVAVSVPGTGSNMTDFSSSRALDLHQAAGYDSAVFQWAGGKFPQNIPDATKTSFSHDLAPKLAEFVDGVAKPTGSTMTVLGHSYGGATVGLAEKAGMHADRVMYVSAAGMGDGVSGVKDFPNTSTVPHYSLMSRNDIVVGLIQGKEGQFPAIHGQSSLSADGVTRLETGFVDAGNLAGKDIESTGAIKSHSSVYTPGSTSFNNIVAVITGGRAETFAEDQIIPSYFGEQPIIIHGIDRSDYKPAYIEVP